MPCNAFIGETLVRTQWFQTILLFQQLLLCTKNRFLTYKHLDVPLDEGRFVFECILAGNLQAFPTCRPQLFHVQDTLDYTLHLFGLTFFL